jgi:hypothetical protein
MATVVAVYITAVVTGGEPRSAVFKVTAEATERVTTLTSIEEVASYLLTQQSAQVMDVVTKRFAP